MTNPCPTLRSYYLVTGAAQRDLGALGLGIGDVLLDLVEGGLVDQRAQAHAVVEAGSDLQLLHRLGQLGGKGVVDTVLHQDAVDRKSTRLNSSHSCAYRMPSSA